MPPHILKDTNTTLSGTYNGDESLTGASLTWAFLPLSADFSKDLDVLIEEDALFTHTTDGGGVTVTSADAFTVDITDEDTDELSPGTYWTILRGEASDGTQISSYATKVELVVYEEPSKGPQTFWDLVEEVGAFLGLSPEPVGEEFRIVRRVIESGYQQFLYPPAELPYTYRWSFLQPVDRLYVSENNVTLSLPDDFASLASKITLQGDYGVEHVQRVPEWKLRQYHSQYDRSGPPKLCAIRPASSDRYELMIYPQADGHYTLKYRYERQPDALYSPLEEGRGTLSPIQASITGVDTSGDTVTVSGDATLYLGVGEMLDIEDNTGDLNGSYEVTSLSYDSDTDATTIGLRSDITDATADGHVTPQRAASLTDGDADFTGAGVETGDRLIPGSTDELAPQHPNIIGVESTVLYLDIARNDSSMLSYEVATDDIPLLGCPQHYQTIVESCLAMAEQRQDDVGGLHTQMFRKRLQTSQRRDEKANSPDTVGTMRKVGQRERGERNTQEYNSFTVYGKDLS